RAPNMTSAIAAAPIARANSSSPSSRLRRRDGVRSRMRMAPVNDGPAGADASIGGLAATPALIDRHPSRSRPTLGDARELVEDLVRVAEAVGVDRRLDAAGLEGGEVGDAHVGALLDVREADGADRLLHALEDRDGTVVVHPDVVARLRPLVGEHDGRHDRG